MQHLNDQLLFSPSGAARGAPRRPAAEPFRRKGQGHKQAFLATLSPDYVYQAELYAEVSPAEA